MKLSVLGTATPYPVPGNACSGYLLRSAEATLWIDAGTGTLAELQRHVSLLDVDAVFISHRHADHSADLLVAYYALRFSALRPTRRLRVFGPEALADRLADFLGPDALQGIHEAFEFTELSGWGDEVIGDVGLSWGPVSHGVPAFALSVRSSSRADGLNDAAPMRRTGFTYSGDTGACASLVEMAEESSTLLCEVGYSKAALGESAVHHTPEDAGRSATAAGVQRLILTHLADDLADDEAVQRARSTFAGDIRLAHAGDRFTV